MPMGGSSGPVRLSHRLGQGGRVRQDPDRSRTSSSTLCRNLKKNGHPCGFALGHALGDANGYAQFLLWAHGGRLVDEDGHVVLDSKETRAALDYAKAMQETMIPGTLAWNDASNNKAFAVGRHQPDLERRLDLLRRQDLEGPGAAGRSRRTPTMPTMPIGVGQGRRR